jgi:hypothetical protein
MPSLRRHHHVPSTAPPTRINAPPPYLTHPSI